MSVRVRRAMQQTVILSKATPTRTKNSPTKPLVPGTEIFEKVIKRKKKLKIGIVEIKPEK
jgi:hypothetical protein